MTEQEKNPLGVVICIRNYQQVGSIITLHNKRMIWTWGNQLYGIVDHNTSITCKISPEHYKQPGAAKKSLCIHLIKSSFPYAVNGRLLLCPAEGVDVVMKLYNLNFTSLEKCWRCSWSEYLRSSQVGQACATPVVQALHSAQTFSYL